MSTESSTAGLRPCSIVIYCGDTRGLGHLRRNMAIASGLVREIPESRVLLLTSVPTDVFECPAGVDVVKLPDLTKDPDGGVRARRLRMDRAELERMREGIIDSVVREFSPDLVLIDHQPTGLWNELLPTLQRLRGSHRAPCTVLGLRDILDDARTTTIRWQHQGIYRWINRLYDAVLIYGSPKIFDTRRHYRLDRRVRTRVSYCGYVCAADDPAEARTARLDLRPNGEQLVVVTAGGGADGHPMLRLCIEALSRPESRSGVEAVCITGPLMSRAEIQDLRTRSTGLPIRVKRCVRDTHGYFEAADLIVTMAGYNTVLEALRLKKRILVIPRIGPSAEQAIRTEILARSGLIRAVATGERNPEGVARRITQSLAADPPSTDLPNMDGLQTTVRHLKTLLSARQARNGVAGGSRVASIRSILP